MKKEDIKIAFMGTPLLGSIVLDGLIKKGFLIDLVITAPDKPSGRKNIITPPPVKITALENNIQIIQPNKIAEAEETIKKINPDIIIIAAYGKMIPEDIISIPKYGCVNVHPSLLPKYRGPSPIQGAILNNEEKTGVTLFKIDKNLDSGPILLRKEVKINKKENAEDLGKNLFLESVQMLENLIPRLVEGKIKEIPQNDKEATFTKIIKKEDGRINWKESAKKIELKIRAYYPWPSAFTYFKKNDKNLIVKIIEGEEKKEKSKNHFPGKVFLCNKNLAIQCGKDILIIKKIQIEGKNVTTSEDFLRGQKEFLKSALA